MRYQRTDAAAITADLRQKILSHEYDENNRLPSIRELSIHYGASVNTVSKALKALAAENLLVVRERVGYIVRSDQPKSGVSNIVAVAVGVSQSPIWLKLLSGVQDRLNTDGYNSLTLMMGSNFSTDLFLDNLKRVLALGVKGLIIVPPVDSASVEAVSEILKCGIHVVFADRYYMDVKAPYVVSDNMYAAYKLTRMLTKAGHTKIGFVHTNHAMTVEERFSGFRQACYDAGMEYEDISDIYIPMHSEDLGESFEEFSTRFLEKISRIKVTALFTANNQIAEYTMRTLVENGFNVPQDYSVVTFDANMLHNSTPYRLTGIAQNMYEIGYKCAETVLNQINGNGSGKSSGFIVASDVLVADSIRPIQKKEDV